MDDNIGLLPYSSVISRNGHAGRFHPARDAVQRFSPGVALLGTLLLSLALWGAIWLAASELPTMWP
jgi:hypothetical protein